jgi:transposase InsO family protein
MVYVAFAIDVFARRIVGWRASRTASAQFVLDALEQAVHMRRPSRTDLAERRFLFVIAASFIKLLRRPLESAQ